MWPFPRDQHASLWHSDDPIREELFGSERLAAHARSLALAQDLIVKTGPGLPLAARLAENEKVLLETYETTAAAVAEGRTITPANEELIDNYHVVEKQIHQIRSDLPAGYYRVLPKLASGPFAGYPRVFGLAWAYVAHTDSNLDREGLLNYVSAYQEIQPLTIGELWAISITLRIVLIENLRRLAERIRRSRSERDTADRIADWLLGARGVAPEALEVVLQDQNMPLPTSMAVQLVYRLRDQDARIAPALAWLDKRLAEQATNIDAVVTLEHTIQGSGTVTVRNIITSLRRIADIDWKDLFEDLSAVDRVLGTQESFKEMDFPTRNLYRGAVEQLARGSGATEREVAGRAIAMAQSGGGATASAGDVRRSDAGFYLIGEGLKALERDIGFRTPLRQLPKLVNATFGIWSYVVPIAVVAVVLLALPLLDLAGAGLAAPLLIAFAILGLVPAIDVAVALVNRAVPWGFSAQLLPALEFRDGIPQTCATLVAVPTLLTSIGSIKSQVERLEIHHLSNPEANLYFALLSDWLDAKAQTVEGDAELLAEAQMAVADLNRRYESGAGGTRFLLLHRKRVWCESENCWMGWERKRGKLHELNRLLRGAGDTNFLALPAGESLPSPIRYVVTLDADTRLPRDAVRSLVGKMAHPLNQPRFDANHSRVTEGYAVLQPRVTPSLPVGQEGSLFQRVFSSMGGIDPYASAVSDVYQDLFGEGSYAGKGIYDVDAFEAAMAGRVPDSTLLSHDLFEGIFVRAGLATDIEVVEEFPARYDVGAMRHHRWARGDWQLLPWLFGNVGAAAAGMKTSAVPIVGKWKMLDNLRRTLSAPLAILALIIGWMLPANMAETWTVFVISTIVLPTLIPIISAIPADQSKVTLGSHLRSLLKDLKLAASLSSLVITFLAHQAWLMSDAILRTLWRLLVSRKNLLEWVPAAQASAGSRLDLVGFYRHMYGAIVVAAVAMLAGWRNNPVLAVAFGVLWIVSPVIARWVSLPPDEKGQLLVSDQDTQFLRLIARRTWRFFEGFVTANENMLPPDNYQEDPAAVAHRTSPTNIGLYLLAAASARDFGWAGTVETVGRLEATLATMATMERYRGHFYNWYDTRDLHILEPRYVSSVDSGNLAGHLIALANTCREWREKPQDNATRISGLTDIIALAQETLNGATQGAGVDPAMLLRLKGVLSAQLGSLNLTKTAPELAEQTFFDLARAAAVLADASRSFSYEGSSEVIFWADAYGRSIASHLRDFDNRTDIHARLSNIETASRAMALAMDFQFMIDPERKLLSIGCRLPEGVLDSYCYDLLASEARLASFFAIAKGDVPASHWFRLGRSVTPVAQGAALISWSGSMFEYLMPSLIMRAPAGSLIEQTNKLIVESQIAYGSGLRLPWGISESAYNARDLELTYQYSNFGVPELGLKRGLSDNNVIAPYATALASMVDPRAACQNMVRLRGVGALGRYGFYESLDYTPARVPEGQDMVIVRAYMAHHQGMTIVAIADALMDGAMRARFHSEPIVQATELLLQERAPREVALAIPRATEVSAVNSVLASQPSGVRRFNSASQRTPATHMLSNGRYALMMTAAGSGYSRWREFAVTRWREDATCDDYGSYIFLNDVRSGDVWSAGLQPTGHEPDDYSVEFNEDRVQFIRQDGSLTTTMDALVSPEDDAEVRRILITNSGIRARELDITSYSELVLAAQSADIAHQAFSKLFVETEYVPEVDALIATRRKRTHDEPEIWAAHIAICEGQASQELQYETDRARFIGRGQTLRTARAVQHSAILSNTAGTVLDPIFSMRKRIKVLPGATVRVVFWTMVASTRKALLDLIDQHRDAHAVERAITLSWTQAQVQLHHLGISASEAALFQRLGGYMIYASPDLRPSSDAILRGANVQSGLWARGISGDLPILLLRISESDDLDIVHQLLQAQEYWRMKKLAVDLVILNERQSSYVQDLQSAIDAAVRMRQSRRAPSEAQTGQVHVLRADLIPVELRMQLASVARVVIVAQRGSLFDQLDRMAEEAVLMRPPIKALLHARPVAEPRPMPELEVFNGLGGFANDGRAYVTVLRPGLVTPMPWINVISNPDFGFQVSTEGSGYTWAVNSRENQLTPWSNDPVTDRVGEAFYLRDEENGAVWSPTALPIRDALGTYVATHGRGFSKFEHSANEIDAELLQYVPLQGSIKISRLKLHNASNRTRHISVTAYVEWVLASNRGASLNYVTTALDDETGAIVARNPWSNDFSARVAFLDMGGLQSDWSGDRREFIGRNGSTAEPKALLRAAGLSKTFGAGLDPCGALRRRIVLRPGESVEAVSFLGQGANLEEARALIKQYRAADLDGVLADVGQFWTDVLEKMTVKTPDRSMDIMLNGWLLYQTLACRVWARSAFYQSSGAYGFRDQLQDGMALAATKPQLTRQHLLRAAARQFVEGDVQHWWLPHSGQGVRTRISDDRVWLGFIVSHYLGATGDIAVLDEKVGFLEGQRLADGEHDNFFLPNLSEQSATLFEHCARALDNSLGLGQHGLPLMGTGDWNDGMNRVGELGRGESVWLGWLLVKTLTLFATLADKRGEGARGQRWQAFALELKRSLEREAWDGAWYRRGYFDDGSPLGSSHSEECKIDSIAQSWAVLSGAGDPARAAQAMLSVDDHLIDKAERLALLFTPPFDKTSLEPGYIKGYPPGIRENGGQYTHAATWSIMAFAELGDGDKAASLFAMLNPVNHARTPEDVARYKVEPYVMAADIYSVAPHQGRGGWTWYTGAAGWMQRAGTESILGLKVEAGVLCLEPCIPKSWPGFEVVLKHGAATYKIEVANPAGVTRGIAAARVDGAEIAGRPLRLPLNDDGKVHSVHITLGG